MGEVCKSCGLPIAENAVSFALLSKNPDKVFWCMNCGAKCHYVCLDDDGGRRNPHGWCKLCRAERALTHV